MRSKIISILLVMLCTYTILYADSNDTNVNVVLEIEGEYKFEPFPEPSEGFDGFLSNGVLRVIKESSHGMSKYTALNDAMQKAREAVWKVIVHSYISDGVTVRDAILNAPPYMDYTPKESEKKKFEAMSEKERSEFILKNGKEKKYDFEKFINIVKECGSYTNSGRFYDSVEKTGYACIEVSLKDFFHAVDNDKINIFKDIKYGAMYKPVDQTTKSRYDGIIIDASDTAYVPSLFVKVLAPTEETVYAGIAGRKNIFFAADMDKAKEILAKKNVKRAYRTSAQGASGDVGVKVGLSAADNVFSAVAKNSNIPFVIIYKNTTDKNTEPAGE